MMSSKQELALCLKLRPVHLYTILLEIKIVNTLKDEHMSRWMIVCSIEVTMFNTLN